MSGNTVVAAAAAVVTFVATGGNPVAAQWAFIIAQTAGAILFPPKGPDGPRLNDLTVQVSTYGQSIPRVWGTVRIAGNIIWATDLQEHAQEEGGKGGPTYATYSYTCSFAIQWCQGEVIGVRRMWANKTLRYDVRVGNTGPTADGAGWYGGTYTSGSTPAGGFVFYPGSATQPVDPTIQAHKGNTPAYRHRAYSVHEDLSLEKYSNALPQVEAEIVANGTLAVPAPETLYDNSAVVSGYTRSALDPNTGYLYHIPTASSRSVQIVDPINKTLVANVQFTGATTDVTGIAYCPTTNTMWCIVDGNYSCTIYVVSCDSLTVIRTISSNTSGGDIVWNPARGQMVATPGNFSLQTNICEYEPITYAETNLGQLRTFNYRNTLFVQDGALLYNQGLLFLAAGANLDVLDTFSMQVIAQLTVVSGVSANERMTYDKVRQRVLIVQPSSTSYSIVSLPSLTVSGGTFASPGANMIHYHAGLDKVFTATGGSSNYIIQRNADTLAVERTFDMAAAGAGGVAHLVDAEGLDDRLYTAANSNAKTLAIYLLERLTPQAVPVSEIISDLSEAVGLTAADLDVTDISGILCDGFVLANRGAAQAGIEQLLMAYQVDVVESGGKVKYVRRASRSAVVIDPEEMGLHEVGQDAPTRLILTRADEVDLPRSVTIKYMNKDADYQIGAQTATRQTTLSRNDVTHELAVVMTDAHAKAVAEAVNYATWAGRTTAKWSMSLKYAELEPTDLVSIDGNYILISKATRRGNMIECEGVFHSGLVFVTGSAAGAAEPVAQTIPLRSKTAIEFMDIPLLRDQDNDAGFYVAACGYPGQEWRGCVLFKSSDGGGTWEEALTLTAPGTMGVATTALGDYALNLFDEFNRVTVVLRHGTLASASEVAVLNGANAALLGSEIIQFKTATLNADGSYTLSGLLRGRRGSPTSGHQAGERFVLLNTASVRRVDMSVSEIGLERLYKAVSIGDSLAGARTLTFTNTAVGLECLSPVQLGGGRDASGNLALNWLRRTRIGGEWRDWVDVPLGEASEAYEVEIWDSTFATLKRTITGLSAPSASYTAAQQTTDFGGVQSTVYVRVYQTSATVGRGFALQGSI